MRKKCNFSLEDVEPVLKTKSWWASIAILPFSNRLTVFILNRTNITPNQITIFGFLVSLISAFCFFDGYLLLGALLFEFSYLLDCVDGSVARLKGLSSDFGAYLDSITDALKIFACSFGLGYGQYLITQDITYLLLGFIYSSIYIIKVMSHFRIETISLSKNKAIDPIQNKIQVSNNSPILKRDSVLQKIKTYFDSKRISILPTTFDFEAIVFFICPILDTVKIGLIFGSIALLLILLGYSYIYFSRKTDVMEL